MVYNANFNHENLLILLLRRIMGPLGLRDQGQEMTLQGAAGAGLRLSDTSRGGDSLMKISEKRLAPLGPSRLPVLNLRLPCFRVKPPDDTESQNTCGNSSRKLTSASQFTLLSLNALHMVLLSYKNESSMSGKVRGP